MATLTRRNVRATYLSTDGRRLRGKVTFTPSVTLYDDSNNIVLLPRPIEAFPDDDGLVSIDLPITDDADHNPTDWHYVVVEDFENGPSRQRYWIQVPDGSGSIELADQIVDEDPPKPFVKLIPGPQGDAGTTTLGTVNVRNPNQDPTISNTGTAQNAVFNFGLPRAADLDLGATTVLDADENPSVAEETSVAGDKTWSFSLPQAKDVEVGTVTEVNPDQSPTVADSGDANTTTLDFDLPRAADVTLGTVSVVDNDQNPAVTDSGTDGDVVLDIDLPQAKDLTLGTVTVVNPDQNPAIADSGDVNGSVYDFDLPRAPNFTVGTVTTGAPGSSASVTDVGTDGDIELDFSIPKGLKGDTGLGVEDPIGADGTLLAAQSGNVSGTEWVDEVTLDALTLDTAAAETTTEAKMLWNADQGTFEIGMEGAVPLFVGHNVFYRVKNQTGGPLNKGKVCAFDGTLGASGVIKAKLADIASDGVDTIMGVAAHTIGNGEDGFVLAHGKLRKVNTTGFAAESLLWADPSSPGDWVDTEPARPRVLIAAVVYEDNNNGEIVVRPTWDHTVAVDELEDVSASAPNDGDILRYNNSTSEWESQAFPVSVSLGLVLALGG